ncbi:MAG: hypothetical protein V3575_06575 [Candidatus Absconditabacteria bacterium]
MTNKELKKAIQQKMQEKEKYQMVEIMLSLVKKYKLSKIIIDFEDLKNKLLKIESQHFNELAKYINSIVEESGLNDIMEILSDYHNMLFADLSKVDRNNSKEFQDILTMFMNLFRSQVDLDYLSQDQIDKKRLKWSIIQQNILGGMSPDQIFYKQFQKHITDFSLNYTKIESQEDLEFMMVMHEDGLKRIMKNI